MNARRRTFELSSPAASAAPAPDAPAALDDVLAGLRAPCKHLPCRLLYDARGAELFDQICTLDEYYPTRAETALLREHLPAAADLIGPHARIIEPGSGAGQKTRMLLSALARPASYVPIDVCAEQLETTAAALRVEFPGLEVHPVCSDYAAALDVPGAAAAPAGRTAIFFPGSTIGNFEPDDARRFLARFAAIAGPGGVLVLGADGNHDPGSLLRAYDDAAGVTAAFDLNVLRHLNCSHGAGFDLGGFMHRAVWNAPRSRIEMHLVSRRRQHASVAGHEILFERGEVIVTEHCYKHSEAALSSLLDRAGWSVRRVFADPEGRMRLWLAERAPAVGPAS